MNRICTLNGRTGTLSSVVSQLLGDPAFEVAPTPTRPNPVLMAIDLFEGPSHVTIRASVPGVSKDKIDVQVADGVLSIAAELPDEPLGQGEEVLRRERRFGRVERSVSLPADVSEEGGEAKLQDGVLTLRLPKLQKPGPKKITIN
jgi:HSP20 family protein